VTDATIGFQGTGIEFRMAGGALAVKGIRFIGQFRALDVFRVVAGVAGFRQFFAVAGRMTLAAGQGRFLFVQVMVMAVGAVQADLPGRGMGIVGEDDLTGGPPAAAPTPALPSMLIPKNPI